MKQDHCIMIISLNGPFVLVEVKILDTISDDEMEIKIKTINGVYLLSANP